MEMMIVMLIVAVVAAASAPMINKKMLQDQANDSPWVWTGTDNSIAYNLKGNATQTAVIGAIKAPSDATKNNTKLHIESEGTQLTLKKKGTPKSFQFKVDGSDGSSIYIVDDSTNSSNQTNCVEIGNNITALQYPNMTLIGAETYGEHHSTALGYRASAKSDRGGGGASTAIGAYSQTKGQKAVAIGASNNETNPTQATGTYALAVGSSATASGESSIAIGGADSSTDAAKAETTGSIAIGKIAKAITYNYTTAIGYNAQSTGLESIALGYNAQSTVTQSIALGSDAQSTGVKSTALGCSADAGGTRAIAIGDATASNTDSIAIGYLANSSVTDGYAFGYKAQVSGVGSVAIGRNTEVTAENTIQLGSTSNTPTVYIPGNLVVDGMTIPRGGLDLSSITGTITIGANNATVKIPGYVELGEATYSVKMGVKQVNGKGALFKTVKREPTDDPRVNIFVHTSDRRLKNVGKAFKAGLAEIKKLEVFNYTFKDDKNKTPLVGVIAQDLQKIFPDAVFKGEDGFLSIRMEDMFYALVNAVKELDAKINLLEQKQKRIDELEKRLEKLEKRLEKLEKGKQG